MIIDIHTHKGAPYPEGIVDVSALVADGGRPQEIPGQLYSVGIHPWSTVDAPSDDLMHRVADVGARPDVAAIGESGIDTVKGGPMFRQLKVFRSMIELSERLRKPLIIHCVKAEDVILGLRRDLAPRQNWLVHGFRKKPQAAAMLLDAGIRLSFGEKFNAETLRSIPDSGLFAETDASPLTISEIVAAIAAARGTSPAALLPLLAANAAFFLTPPNS